MHQRSNSKSRFLRRLKREAAAMKNFEDRTVTEHMIVVMVASEVGTDVDQPSRTNGVQERIHRKHFDPNAKSLRSCMVSKLMIESGVTLIFYRCEDLQPRSSSSKGV